MFQGYSSFSTSPVSCEFIGASVFGKCYKQMLSLSVIDVEILIYLTSNCFFLHQSRKKLYYSAIETTFSVTSDDLALVNCFVWNLHLRLFCLLQMGVLRRPISYSCKYSSITLIRKQFLFVRLHFASRNFKVRRSGIFKLRSKMYHVIVRLSKIFSSF